MSKLSLNTPKSSLLRNILMILAGCVFVFLATEYYKNNTKYVSEKFVETVPSVDTDSDVMPEAEAEVLPNDDELSEQYKPVDFKEEKIKGNCFPKDKLTAEDLLPKDAANSKWAEVNPAGQGELKNQNFLTAGYHVGINTVGNSLRNPNMQIRSEPINPQVKVSPWMQSTIEPDLNRKPLEISDENDDTCE